MNGIQGAALSASLEASGPTGRTKVCPRCGAEVFADMDVCYGCLYDFTRANLDYPGSGSVMGAEVEARGPAISADAAAVRGAAAETTILSASALGSAVCAETASGRAGVGRELRGVEPAAARMDASEEAPTAEFPLAAAASRRFAQAAPPIASPLPQAVSGGDEEEFRPASASGAMAPEALARPAFQHAFLRLRWRGVEALVPLETRRIAIGRRPQSDVVLSDFSVLDEHATVELAEGGGAATVTLLSPEARAMKDGLEVAGSTELRAGEELDIAGARFALVRREEAMDRRYLIQSRTA